MRGTYIKTRQLFVLPPVLLSLGITACGDTTKITTVAPREDGSPTQTSYVAPTTRAKTTGVVSSKAPANAARADRDNDSDNNNDDYGYGHAASTTDRQAIASVVKTYYTAAAAGDGAKGCSLMYSLFAEEIPEVYGEPPGPPWLRGTTCPAVMSKVFKRRRRQMIIDHTTLRVTAVRVKRLRALVMLSFDNMPQRDILVHREHHAWKVDNLLDTDLG